MPSMKNRTRISLFVTQLYHRNRISLCGCVYSPALVFGCHRYLIQLTSMHLQMLLSCTVTRGIWRSQLLICDDTAHTACSARTSPYRQGLNSYIVHCHSLFQAFRTLTKLDIIYSLKKFFYQHIAIHGEHYLRAWCLCSWPSQTLSATSRKVAQQKNLNVCKTGATSLIGIAG